MVQLSSQFQTQQYSIKKFVATLANHCRMARQHANFPLTGCRGRTLLLYFCIKDGLPEQMPQVVDRAHTHRAALRFIHTKRTDVGRNEAENTAFVRAWTKLAVCVTWCVNMVFYTQKTETKS